MTTLTHTLMPFIACAQPMGIGSVLGSYRSHSASREWHVEETAPTSLYAVHVIQAGLARSAGFSPDVQSVSLAEVGNHVFHGSRAMNHKERSTFNMLMAKQSKRIR